MPAVNDQPDAGPERMAAPLRELAALFLKLGATSFGGPAVHIAMLEQEVVHRRNWMTHAEFLDLLGATNLIPGPNSTEMAIHIGLRRGGWRGLLIAGACFILPAFFITFACAWFYARYAELPRIHGALHAVKPVVLVIVLQALWRLAPQAARTPRLTCIAVATFALNLLGVHELALLILAGLAVPLIGRFSRPASLLPCLNPIGLTLPALPLLQSLIAVAGNGATAWKLFLFFAKIGSVLYGSGYVLLAFLRAGLVERWQWLTESQLLDAIAIGQFTPGPVFTSATFIGYVIAGPAGACTATAGIFLPAFVFVAISAPLIPRLRRSPLAASILDGVNVASLALMAAVTCQLARSALTDWSTVLIGIIGVILLLSTRLNPAWLILAAALVGLAAMD